MISSGPIDYLRTPFVETQRFGRTWVWGLAALVGVLPLIPAIIFVRLVLRGAPLRSPAILTMIAILLFALVLPTAVLMMVRMTVAVTSSEIIIRFFPVRRRIALADVTSFKPIAYDWKRSGGWGIKWKRGQLSYAVSGDRAMELTLASGKRVVVGTQRPDDLAAALEAAGVTREPT